MTTYRTVVSDQLGHWGVTIVREPNHGGDCFETCNGHTDAQLVAVVVNGDQALAERICALLNAAAPGYRLAIQVLRGVAARSGSDAARWAADYLEADPDRHLTHGTAGPCPEPGVHTVDGDAPSSPAILPVSDLQAPLVGRVGVADPSAAETAYPSAFDGAPPVRVYVDGSQMYGPYRVSCICNDPPPTVDKPKNGTASRPDGWACPRHGTLI